MTLLPFVVLGTIALLLHLALMLAAAPLVEALLDTFDGLATRGRRQLARTPPPSRAMLVAFLSRPWRRLAALLARPPVRARNVSLVSIASPAVALAATMTAAALVPSFGIGMLTGPVADLPAVLALLALARVAVLLGAFDAGVASTGAAAMSSAVRLLLAFPGAVLSLYALSAVFGTTAIDSMLAQFHAGPGLPGSEVTELLASASLGLAALAAAGDDLALSEQLSGPDLALFRFQSSLQRLVWIDLVTALVLPGSLAVAQSNPLHWLLGLLLWSVRVVVACLVLGIARRMTVGLASAWHRRLAGLSALLGLLAPLLLVMGTGE